MAYIYKITNIVNGKCYIGKTQRNPPEKRFQEHLSDSKIYLERPLYRAINKYGKDNFTFVVLEETHEETEREKYWIKFYNSYGEQGYNATEGGDGTPYLNSEKIIQDYLELQNMNKVAKLNNCSRYGVKGILDNYHIQTLTGGEVTKRNHQKKVHMIDKTNGLILQTFSSYMEAGRYLLDNNLSNMSRPDSAADKISLVCRGKRKSFANFFWEVEI